MQFAGASSTGGRRRRRLVVSADGTGVDALTIDGDGTEIESQLVASAAAAPWVPATELRIWIYAGVIGLCLALLTAAVLRPISLPVELDTLARHLLMGSRPRMLTAVQTLFLALSTQMCLLITWYRSQCTLDFAGRYRVWPWAVALIGIATFCTATNIHQVVGEVASQKEWLTWRPHTVAWALPLCLLALPIGLLLDRDMRHSRSSFFTLRVASIQWMLITLCELYQAELQSRSWFVPVRQLLPVFASATLFIGLWLHARIVAYVCPDPPKVEEQSAASTLLSGLRWLASFRLTRKVQVATEPDDEEVTKPKRRRKKASEELVAEEEEAPVKRKRKAPARKTTSRTRTRSKLTEPEEIEQSEEAAEESTYEEAESDYSADESSSSSSYDESSYEEQEQWESEEEETAPEPPAPEPARNSRRTHVHDAHPSVTPAPHASRQESNWEEETEPAGQAASSENDSQEESDDDESYENSGLSADQMKGLSKRQRRELKKQQRDRERTKGR